MSQQRLQLTWYNKDKALIPTETGKYGYTWVDPADPRYCETHTLVYDEHVQGKQTPKSEDFEYSERADLEPQDDNLLILGESGDVLEALTRVPELAEKYVGKVKLIYIDPPFNTAQTFVNYEDNLEHSVWLTMMRDRLLHLKKLLSEDGSIWVHLDDVEVHRMRLLMDEVFGAANFVAEVAWEKGDSPRMDANQFSERHDFLLVYAKELNWSPNKLESTVKLDFPLTDAQGRRYRAPGPLRKWGKNSLREDRPNLWYPIIAPDGTEVWPIKPDGTEGNWRWKASTVEEKVNDLHWEDKGSGLQPYVKEYEDSARLSIPPETWWPNSEAGHNREAKAELKALFSDLNVVFSTPKPERLLEKIIHIGTKPGDIVLDCFAGSGTTAAVAQKMGRRWVTCELVEDTFNRFTKPRLEKVVNDADPGGITRTKGERIDATDDGLPEGLSPDDAQRLTSLLNKAISESPELKKSADIRAVKQMVKTRRSKDVVNWRGGGGFQVAHLSPACFDYDPQLGRVMLTAAATGQVFIESVAANLGFRLLHPDDDYVFDGRRGNSLLKVVEGVATVEVVDWLASQVRPGETIVLAATSVMDGVRQHLRKAVKGSRVVAVPDDVFSFSAGGER